MTNKYSFRLLPVAVTVKTGRGQEGEGTLYTVQVEDLARGDVIGLGESGHEPTAIGRAIMAARLAFEPCAGCGRTFRADDLGQDLGLLSYCYECAQGGGVRIIRAPKGWQWST